MEASSSGGSDSIVVDPKGDVSTAHNPSAGSSLKKDTDAGKPSATSPADGKSPKKGSGELPKAASNFGSNSSKKVRKGKASTKKQQRS